MQQLPRVLLLDANQRSALACVRSLGKARVFVVVADHNLSTLAGSSHYCAAREEYVSPEVNEKEFINSIISITIKYNIGLILPISDLSVPIILKHRHLFTQQIVPFADVNVVNLIANKYELFNIAERLSIPVPRTKYLENSKQGVAMVGELRFPVVIKPFRSRIWDGSKWVSGAVCYANNATEYKNIITNDTTFREHPFLAQECVSGHGEGIFVLYDNGQLIASFAHKRLKEKPPSGGVSVLSESIDTNPLMLSYAKKILDSVAWHGVAMVEFKVDMDGVPYLLEINTRFWGSLQLAIDSGVDFPILLYMNAVAHPNQAPKITSQKSGCRLRWTLGDLDRTYLVIKDKQISFKEKLHAVFSFLTDFKAKNRSEIFRLDDKKPFFYELKQYAKSIFKK